MTKELITNVVERYMKGNLNANEALNLIEIILKNNEDKNHGI